MTSNPISATGPASPIELTPELRSLRHSPHRAGVKMVTMSMREVNEIWWRLAQGLKPRFWLRPTTALRSTVLATKDQTRAGHLVSQPEWLRDR